MKGFGKKTQQLQKDVRFLNQQKKRTEAKIEKLFRNNKVSLSGNIDEKLNDVYVDVIKVRLSQVLIQTLQNIYCGSNSENSAS